MGPQVQKSVPIGAKHSTHPPKSRLKTYLLNQACNDPSCSAFILLCSPLHPSIRGLNSHLLHCKSLFCNFCNHLLSMFTDYLPIFVYSSLGFSNLIWTRQGQDCIGTSRSYRLKDQSNGGLNEFKTMAGP